MLKPLTMLARVELELDANFAGKLWCFSPHVGETAYFLGVSVANEAGYTPIPLHWCHADNLAEITAHADALNAEWLSLTPEESLRIVTSSMAQGKVDNKNKPAGEPLEH